MIFRRSFVHMQEKMAHARKNGARKKKWRTQEKMVQNIQLFKDFLMCADIEFKSKNSENDPESVYRYKKYGSHRRKGYGGHKQKDPNA